MKLCYLPLEPYPERYTELLRDWTVHAWAPACDLTTVDGDRLPTASHIRIGAVLDAAGRGYWATTQTARLLRLLDQGYQPDALYCDDLFHPGLAALPYLFHQWARPVPRIYLRNWAQSIDCYDFTHPMRAWMRPYEQMADHLAAGILVAATCHAEMYRAANLDAPVHVVGLPFDADDVRARAAAADAPTLPYFQREPLVLWSSRWDVEKDPLTFLALAARLHGQARCLICTGAPALRSNDPSLLDAAYAAQARGEVTIYAGCSKADYYRLVSQARVHVNTALQDFVSFAVLEASALGTPTVAPAFRSFPELFQHDPAHLYVPGSVEDLTGKVGAWLDGASRDPTHIYGPATSHSGTFARTLHVMEDAC